MNSASARLSQCTCYVLGLPAADQFAIRWGAHNPACPVFAPSRDPVDNLADAELRYKYETAIARMKIEREMRERQHRNPGGTWWAK